MATGCDRFPLYINQFRRPQADWKWRVWGTIRLIRKLGVTSFGNAGPVLRIVACKLKKVRFTNKNPVKVEQLAPQLNPLFFPNLAN